MDFMAALASSFQRGRVYADGFAFDQAALRQSLQHPHEDLLMSFGVDEPPGSRDRYVIGRPLIQPNAQKLPQSERIGQPPGDATFAIESFKETNHHDPEVEPRCQRRTSQFLVIELSALGLAKAIEARLVENLVEPLVERVARRCW